MQAKPRPWLRHLKWIGVLLFAWILWKIDRPALLATLQTIPMTNILDALVMLFAQMAAKALRWHLLVKSRGLSPDFSESWQVYCIGIFFGSITPSNLGELGRVPYLVRQGLEPKKGIALVAYDRLIDVGVIGMFGIAAVGILFGFAWFGIIVGICALGALLLWLLWKQTKSIRDKYGLEPYAALLRHETLLPLFGTTVLAWICYFTWTVLIARGVGITVPLVPIVSALTLTGIVALLPISPSGLGTRDAALLTFLIPFGVLAPQTVALSMLIFVGALVAGLPGLVYWMQSK